MGGGERGNITRPEESNTFTTSRLPDADADSGRLRNAFCLPKLRLTDDLMERRDMDLELLEFLTAPVSVQMMDPEKWVEAWEIACCENNWWMHMQTDEKGSKWPYCKLCSQWAQPCHLTSNGCRQKVSEYTKNTTIMLGPCFKRSWQHLTGKLSRSGTNETTALAEVSLPNLKRMLELRHTARFAQGRGSNAWHKRDFLSFHFIRLS